VVHNFISKLVEEVCPDPLVRTQLWYFLLERLIPCYKSAMEHAQFLLDVELNGRAVTCNPDFTSLLGRYHQARVARGLAKSAVELPDGVRGMQKGRYVRVDDLEQQNKGEEENEIWSRILEVTRSYYEVARGRFVDNICAQAVDHFLLSGKGSPLRVFDPSAVLSMSDENLDMIAGEDAASRTKRASLKEKIAVLEKAVRVLRG
jgi:hypothetical protein